MAAYGVIGGAIGGAIAVVLGGWISKRLLEKQEKRPKKKKNSEPVSFRPGASWFFFLVGVGAALLGIYMLYYFRFISFLYRIITGEIEITVKLIEDSCLFYGAGIFMVIAGLIWSRWTGSFLGARITISKERLVIEHAAKMPKGKIETGQYGCHHIDVRWEEIRKLRSNINYMKVELNNGECYMFPIGWCREKARAAVRRNKQIKPWK